MPSLVTERIESVKAGIVGAGAFATTELVIIVTKTFVFHLTLEHSLLYWTWLIKLAVGAISGFLFGVTYRYIIRNDGNSHLKDGAVLAFGLVRGLALIEGNSIDFELLPMLFLVVQSIICFAVARLILDGAIARKLIKPFVYE